MDRSGELKRRHRAMWASGDFPRVARETVAPLGVQLVAAAGIRPGDEVLDVAAGAGNVAIPAAEVGASVIASDLTPEMFAAGRAEAERRGVTLHWVEADAEALPFPDDRFDVVVSSMGVMFAPDQRTAASEMIRVCRPGGTIGIISGRPDGKLGQLLVTIARYSPPPPPGFVPPLAWGVPDHMEGLFGDRVTWSRIEPRTHVIDNFRTPSEFVAYYRSNLGPAVLAFETVAGDDGRRANLEGELIALARSLEDGDRLRFPFEYLLAVGEVL